jgi:hypothetical protein
MICKAQHALRRKELPPLHIFRPLKRTTIQQIRCMKNPETLDIDV